MPIDADLLERIKINDPALKILNLSDRSLNANDIKQLVNALTSNTNLTTLHVDSNEIGVEGAKALATNTTLTILNASGNKFGNNGMHALAQAIARNNQQRIKRRDQFIQTVMILARDQGNR